MFIIIKHILSASFSYKIYINEWILFEGMFHCIYHLRLHIKRAYIVFTVNINDISLSALKTSKCSQVQKTCEAMDFCSTQDEI